MKNFIILTKFEYRYHADGGFWDENDDCCEHKCSIENPCVEGEGHCSGSDTCQQVNLYFFYNN